MNFLPLTDIKKRAAGEVLKGLLSASPNESMDAGVKLCRDAAQYGVSLPDFLKLSIKGEGDLSGFEMALSELNLPVRNDFANGVVLQAASETFQTFPGTRAIFPPVIDEILRWANRQDQFEKIEALVGNSRPMSGNELISTVVTDDSGERDTFTVAEGANIPVQSIRATEHAVKMYKHGSAIRTTYEFSRRASLDMLTPYAARIARQMEISKVAHATNLLVNGDGINAGATVINQSSYNSATGITAVAGTLSWQNLLYWLVQRAKAGVAVDTVVGNWDAAFQWGMLFSVTTTNAAGTTAAANLQAVAKQVGNLTIPFPTFAVSSQAPASKLIGITKAETLEELTENGSQISENERSIRNQTIVYTKTENTGYRLVYGDTRSIFNYNA
jgi:hypothetical protein